MFPYKRLCFSQQQIVSVFQELADEKVDCDEKKTKTKTFRIDAASSYAKFGSLTDWFTEYARMQANVFGHPTPLQYWKDHELSIRADAKRRYKKEDPYSLRETLWINAKEATNFNLVLAKQIYHFFLSSSPSSSSSSSPTTVFDPFSGWGDRAIAALSCKHIDKYVGVDSNYELQNGYLELSQVLDSKNKLYFYLQTIESFLLQHPKTVLYDLIFTSPPYFDFETYTQESSLQQTYKQWLTEFWIPVVCQLPLLLKPKAYLVLHIGSTKRTPSMPKDTVEALKPLIPYIGKWDTYCGGKRPIPLWVFQKS
jgi:16S rRNA G966 N2-methylase RsmD